MPDEKKPWQCHLSDRDWAIVFFAWDNAVAIDWAVKNFFKQEAEAAKGHFGDCTGDAEACFKCGLENAYKRGAQMKSEWEAKHGIPEHLKYK